MIPKPPTRSLLPEAFIWLGGLIILGVIAYLPDISTALQLPSSPLQLPSACLSQAAGLGECPGCGLGASIGHALHGEIGASWQAHPMGMLVLGVLAGRIATLFIHSKRS